MTVSKRTPGYTRHAVFRRIHCPLQYDIVGAALSGRRKQIPCERLAWNIWKMVTEKKEEGRRWLSKRKETENTSKVERGSERNTSVPTVAQCQSSHEYWLRIQDANARETGAEFRGLARRLGRDNEMEAESKKSHVSGAGDPMCESLEDASASSASRTSAKRPTHVRALNPPRAAEELSCARDTGGTERGT
ncbi:hypothetical protein B0H11DRAFT_1937053 [Mycena galericulata]|nr:hypothetical protein B0H11DRAFT_1937053 [Mycena galericulata]